MDQREIVEDIPAHAVSVALGSTRRRFREISAHTGQPTDRIRSRLIDRIGTFLAVLAVARAPSHWTSRCIDQEQVVRAEAAACNREPRRYDVHSVAEPTAAVEGIPTLARSGGPCRSHGGIRGWRPRPCETEYLRVVPLLWHGVCLQPARRRGAAHVRSLRVIDCGQGVLLYFCGRG